MNGEVKDLENLVTANSQYSPRDTAENHDNFQSRQSKTRAGISTGISQTQVENVTTTPTMNVVTQRLAFLLRIREVPI
jgi:hypothetical protein